MEEKVFDLTIEALKLTLTDLQPCRIDFSIEIISGKRIAPVGKCKLGDYNRKTHVIRIFSNRHSSVTEVLNTAIHEYVHHLMWEAYHFGEIKRSVVHGKPFRDCFNKLFQSAKIKGIFDTENKAEDTRIQDITDVWFIKDPVLMMGLLSHQLKTNSRIKSFRCGKGIIEYNPQYASFLTREQLEERLKAEVVRILLRHPYRHYNDRGNAFIASNITLNENYKFKELMYKATDYWKEAEYRNQNLEFYYRELNKLPTMLSGQDSGQGNVSMSAMVSEQGETMRDSAAGETKASASDADAGFSSMNIPEPIEASALWEEDNFIDQKIKNIIEWARTSMQWGTLPGSLVQTLIASLRPEMDYRKVLSAFRATVLSSDKMLTRFKPSRRYGFMYMGKKNEFTTRLLIAVDVSGSITDNEIQVFYSAINRFFKYGIKSLDVIQFDAEVKSSVMNMKKAKSIIKVHGRSGTNFQPVINYFEKAKIKYDGLIFFTDGYAPIPEMKPRSIRKTLWICSHEGNYDHHKEWMNKHGKCCWIKDA